MNADRLIQMAIRYGMRFLSKRMPKAQQSPEQQQRNKTAQQAMKVTRRMRRF